MTTIKYNNRTVNQRLLVSANTRHHICDVTTSQRHILKTQELESIAIQSTQILDFGKQACRPHWPPADTNQKLSETYWTAILCRGFRLLKFYPP